MIKAKKFSIGKIGENTINEDAAHIGDSFMAVSDGAGGGGQVRLFVPVLNRRAKPRRAARDRGVPYGRNKEAALRQLRD